MGLVEAPPVRAYRTETERICALPRVSYTGEGIEELVRLPDGTIAPFEVQTRALQALREENGLVGPIAAGRGKTLIALLAGTVLDCDLSIVLTKSGVVSQTRTAIEELRPHFKIRPVRVVSYDSLSRPDGTSFLEDAIRAFSPGRVVVVCDEAHCLAAPTSARTIRVLRFARANPAVRWVMLSGTLLRRELRDVAHLAELALRERSPLPAAGVFGARSLSHLDAWAECLDPRGRPEREHWQILGSLFAWAGTSADHLKGAARVDAARDAFAARIGTAPGVVQSLGDDVGASLIMTPVRRPELPPAIVEALRVLEAGGTDPDGEPVEDDLSLWRKARELSSGFFYRWVWPSGPDTQWLEARRVWARAVRRELEAPEAGYDSPYLIASRLDEELERAARGERVQIRHIHNAWKVWKRERVKPEPPSVAIWLDRYLVDAAIELLLRQKGPAILWFASRAFEDELRARGAFPVYGSGDVLPVGPAHKCAASWKAHGTGRNLQAWHTGIVCEPVDGGDAWEQLLARMHRTGQTADEVHWFYFDHCDAFSRSLASAIETERFVQRSLATPRRLLYASKGDPIL